MNKNCFILTVTALFIALGMSQSLMAKKVKYLGHNYKGEVNEQKVPAGKGVMNVNGLMIEGDFSDRSVSNAEVWRTEYLGTSNTSFSGTITYDESENIVLKAGGVISTKYYQTDSYNHLKTLDPSYVKKTLKKDRCVNSENFEPKELTLPYVLEKMDVSWCPELHIPYFTTYYRVGLKHFDYYNGQTINMDVFVSEKYPASISVKNYKDDRGRIWNFSLERSGEFYYHFNDAVFDIKYPNSSYCKSLGGNRISWEIHYPNGKIVKTNWPPSENSTDPVYNMGNFSFITNYSSTYSSDIIRTFANNVDKEKFTAPYCSEISITSDSLDFEKLSNSEMEKFIREDVIPYIEKGDRAEYTTPNGKYKNGTYTSNKQMAAAAAKRAAAEQADLKRSIANFKKKYGFDPSVNDVRYIVKVGRKFLDILNARKEWVDEYSDCRNCVVSVSLKRDYGTSKCYDFYWMNGAYYMGYFWVSNNVITSIHWGR